MRDGKHLMVADTGYIGIDAELLICNMPSGAATTEALRNRQAMIGYLRSIAENGIGAMERTFTIMIRPPRHSHWALPPRIAVICAYLYNYYREHSEEGHIAEARFDNLEYMLAKYVLG
jgi:DDE superfamily endonuclease